MWSYKVCDHICPYQSQFFDNRGDQINMHVHVVISDLTELWYRRTSWVWSCWNTDICSPIVCRYTFKCYFQNGAVSLLWCTVGNRNLLRVTVKKVARVIGICTLNTASFTGSNQWWTCKTHQSFAAAGLIILKSLVTCFLWWNAFTQNVTPCILNISYIQYWITPTFYILIGLGMCSYSNDLRSYNCVILKPKLQYNNMFYWYCTVLYCTVLYCTVLYCTSYGTVSTLIWEDKNQYTLSNVYITFVRECLKTKMFTSF